MISIRKFVGYAAAAALAVTISTQVALASSRSAEVESRPTQITLSDACKSALTDIKTAFANDIVEDRGERAAVRTGLEDMAEPDNDTAESSGMKGLFAAARTACAPEVAAITPAFDKTFTPSDACKIALMNLKAQWMQGHASPQQWSALKPFIVAARSACGGSAAAFTNG